MHFAKATKSILPLGLIIVIYFLLRLPNLTLQPIFADEAIYVRWAQIAKAEPTLRFISLQDGKTPLFMWALAPLLSQISDPLYAGRLLSVLAGLGTMLGVFAIGWRFFNLRTGLWAALLTAVTPFFVFFDRMALVDSMLAAFTAWSIFLGLLLIKTRRLDVAMFLGLALGGGILTKTPGMVNVALLPLLLLLIDYRQKRWRMILTKLLALMAFASFVALAVYNLLRLGPGFVNLASRNQDYIHPLSRLLQYPLDPLLPHLRDSLEFGYSLLGLPLGILILLGAVITVFGRNRVGLVLLLWFLAPFLYELEFLKTFTARYILYLIPPLIVLAAFALERLTNRTKYRLLATVAILILLLVWPTFFISRLLLDPGTAPLASAERRGYLEDWTAGYGLKDIAKFLDSQSKNGLIIVGTEGGFGTLPDGLWIYLDKSKNVVVKPGNSFIPDSLRAEALNHPTFFVANRLERLKATGSGTLLKEYLKEGTSQSRFAILLYRVLPPK